MQFDPGFLLEIFRHLKIGFFVLDAKGNYVYVNDIYVKLFNKTADYFLNSSIPKFKGMGYISNSVWEQVLRSKAPVTALMTIHHRENELTYHHLTHGIPSFDEEGNINYIYYLIEPLESVNERIQTGMLNRSLSSALEVFGEGGKANLGVVAESQIMKKLFATISTVAKTDASILLTGPTGSGKQVLAEYAHRMSLRQGGKFVCVDCASIPDNLLESELFGYVKGAFTGASAEGKKGQIELAHLGTLFLDEINSMPLSVQTKLLNVLETKKIKRIGAADSKPIDFRLICASNEDLEALTKKGLFREDLYYRINVVPLQVPPLRKRKEDIVQLAFMFMNFFCHKYSCIKVLPENVINAMLDYDWPGNVRELRNFIERVIVTSPNTDLEIVSIQGFLPQSYFQAPPPPQDQAGVLMELKSPAFYKEDFSFHAHMDLCEKQLLQEAQLKFKTPANIARMLKLDLSNVYRKLRKHNIGNL